MASKISENILGGLDETVEALASSHPLLGEEHRKRLLSQVDVLTDSREGLEHLLDRMPALIAAGVFQGGAWEDPNRLVPPLVGGTLRAGGPTALMEILSELRMIAAAEGRIELPGFPRAKARAFLREVLVNTLDLLFPGRTEEDRVMAPAVRGKIDHLMALLLERVELSEIKGALATEIELICLQRPVVTDRALEIIRLVEGNVPIDPSRAEERRLGLYVRAVFSPSPEAGARSLEAYGAFLDHADEETLEAECRSLGRTLKETGLATGYHALLVRRIASEPALLDVALDLDQTGRAELQKHLRFVSDLIEKTIHPDTARSVYGLGRLLDRGLLSRQPVRSGLQRLGSLELHPEVEEAIGKSRPESRLPARQLLLADCLGVLGQPLGVGQGRNPTCQSARGISLWSRHAPGKLIGMIESVGRSNELAMRFEAQVIRSNEVGLGLLKEFDHDLDAVSVVLVPHLDRIYNEMMQRSSYRGEDPHKWVNPAMYGHWIPTGFVSAYDYGSSTILDYARFLRTFYATHHPDFNRGHDLAYPNPVGIFLTASSGDLIGFHAVSILRVRRARETVRVYLYNPNSEGRQRWHSDIRPTVAGNGERPGESSLPFDQFASRIYAFHFSPSDVGDLEAVPDERVEAVTRVARESWGKSYDWLEAPPPPQDQLADPS